MTFIGAGTTGHVEDLVVRDTEAESGSGLFGPGMTVLEGAEIVLERALLKRNREAGLLVLDSETAVTLISSFAVLPVSSSWVRTSAATKTPA